jgi:hypothetical protein
MNFQNDALKLAYSASLIKSLINNNPQNEEPDFAFKSDKLDNILSHMCKSGNLSSAILADAKGLAIAAYNNPVKSEIMAAFTGVLGDSFKKAEELLSEKNGDNISMDINRTNRLTLKKFKTISTEYYLLVICPQDTDEKKILETAVARLSEILK